MYELTMSGPGKNALGTEMMLRLIDQLKEAAGAPVLLTGAGDSFSAGLNLKEVVTLDNDGMERFLRNLTRVTTALYEYPGPTVAWVNGHAIAGGCVLALCCDHRVCTSNPRAMIGLNEVALGLRFPPTVLSIVRSRIPIHHRETVIMGAGLHGPEDARRLGLVHTLAKDDTAARGRLEALARHPRPAYAGAKKDLCTAVSEVNEAEERHFIEHVLPFWTTPELKQNIRAVLARLGS